MEYSQICPALTISMISCTYKKPTNRIHSMLPDLITWQIIMKTVVMETLAFFYRYGSYEEVGAFLVH
jgi:hypothetical protein